MKTLKELYRIGIGPSSSHTMAPRNAAEQYKERHPEAASFRVTLYGSLAATGRGHMTDVAIIDALSPAPTEIVWQPRTILPFHTNGMKFEAIDTAGASTDPWTVYSVGGGALAEENKPCGESPDIYEMTHMSEILAWCERTGKSYWEYVDLCEEPDIWDYLGEVWSVMRESVARGLDAEGILPGPLNLGRKASKYYIRALGYKQSLQTRGLVFAYALAVSEENASGGRIVTAPTCGSCGVVLPPPERSRIQRHAHSAGTGNGRTGGQHRQKERFHLGCRGGVSGRGGRRLRHGGRGGQPALRRIGRPDRICGRGMTCDPVCGLVQIPCIERNAYAATRALDANVYSSYTDGTHRVSFDKVVEVMKQTGHDLPSLYKETSEGGLAKDYHQME